MDDQLHLLTGVYALNALDGEERGRFEDGLPFGHPTAQEARELSETAALLAAGTTPVAPPPALKERLMAQIALTPQAEVAPEPVHDEPVQEEPVHEEAPGRLGEGRRRVFPTSARSFPTSARSFPTSARWLAAAAAVLLLAAGGAGVWGFQQQQERDQAVQALAAAQGSRSAVMDRILSAPDGKVQEVAAPGGATMLIAHSKDAGVAGVVTIGMAPPPQGKAYELWLIDPAGAAKPAGLVKAGDGSTWNELSGGLGNAAYLGVTVEPAGGSPHPTTKPILLQSLA
ncbi:anti-sigma factor [Sinomonas terrae]|uniref:Regulator of SigK n=1 Tax=Sinomonas terrae TaxID=2908838 RepID=A0ABS9U6M0_9MICC|nr:anti-sigma factor [Sinomonas terrae]MCH6472336.1 anti-sigma factor [Sinomonas terrae]